MTTRILPQSGQAERASIYAAALQKARKTRGTSSRAISQAAGVSRTLVLAYLRGDNIPSVPVAERIAEALKTPELLRLAQEARIRSCKRCRREIAVLTGRPPDYCSTACRQLGVKTTRAPESRKLRILTDELRSYRNRIAEMCAACPDGSLGYCAGVDCPLRPVSPLPLGKPAQIVTRAARRTA